MAENKKGFVLYADQIHTIEKLTDVKAGKLFKHILEYVNDKNPQTDDIIVQIAFEPIKQQLKRDLVKFEAKKEQWREAGKRSAEVKKQRKSTESTDVEVRSTESTVTAKDKVKDTVTVTVNNNQQQHTHEDFSKMIFSEENELDRVNIELQLSPKRLLHQLEVRQFNAHLQTVEKVHETFKEWKEHLRNWLNTKPKTAQKTNTNGNNFSKAGKGHNITGIVSAADQILHQYSGKDNIGSDRSEDPEPDYIEKRA